MSQPSIIQIERRVRPLRIGFDLDVTDARVVRDAIEIATTQWGGLLFPLVPNFRQRPRWWLGDFEPLKPAKEIRSGFAAAFRPDYRIALPPDDATPRTYRSISYSDITTQTDEWSGILSGLPVTAVYRDLWERDARFLQRESAAAATVTAASDGMALFGAACFGAFPPTGDLKAIASHYERDFSIEKLSLTPQRLLDGFPATARGRFLGPLQVGSYGLNFRGHPATAGLHLMLLDPRRTSDVVDFWNLRALGRHIVPIPIEWLDALLSELPERLTSRPRGRWGEHIRVIGAQCVSEDAVAAAASDLGARGLKVVRSRYPCFWQRGTDEPAWNVFAEEDRAEASVRDGRVRVGLLAPRAAQYYPGGVARWMSMIEIVPWTLSDPGDGLASLFPSALEDVPTLLGAYTHLDVRAADDVLAVPSGSAGDALDWAIPTGRQVLASLLGSASDTKPKPSQPGLIAEELIRRIGGLDALGLINDRSLIDLLDRAAVADVELDSEGFDGRRRPRTGLIPRKTLLAVLNRRHAGDGKRALGHLRALVERGVLISGPRLVCPPARIATGTA